jgi:hypothetical protein
MLERQSFICSAVVHLMVVLAAVIGLPRLFQPKVIEDQPIAVQLVNVAPETRATQKNPTPPVPDQKPDVAQTEPPPKPQPPTPEPPKPEPPKPEPPKPEPPKPPPPKPEVKPAPPKPPQKDQDVAFDALLKTLAKRQAADNSPPDKAKPSPPPPRAASSQPIAPLGPQLSTSEIDLVRQQIERCWVPPAGARDAKDLTPEFRVSMNHDGTVRSADLMNGRSDDPFFQAAADSARRALLNANCHGPLKLPPEKFDLWQTFTITFDPKDIT